MGSEGWWGLTWLDKVKEKSDKIITMYKEDLSEFTKTITDDTKEALRKTTNPAPGEENFASQTLNGITGFFGNFAQDEAKKPDEDKKTGIIVNRHQGRIIALQNELSTYCTEPTDAEEFLAWKKDFRIQSMTDEISRLWTTNEKIREIHTKLVPLAVSYADFWERYYFKLLKLNQEEERRAALVKRATNTQQDEEEVGWDMDDDEAAKVTSDSKLAAKTEEVEEYFEQLDVEDKESKPQEQPQETQESEKTEEAQEKVPETVSPVEPTIVEAKEPLSHSNEKDMESSQKEEKLSEPAPNSTNDLEEDWDNWE